MLYLDDLAAFVEVADAGGVSAAARRLGVSKSIVSRRLVRLESGGLIEVASSKPTACAAGKRDLD
jgi:Mn-dependent DtxR family transcriptional regulator